MLHTVEFGIHHKYERINIILSLLANNVKLKPEENAAKQVQILLLCNIKTTIPSSFYDIPLPLTHLKSQRYPSKLP